MIAAQPDTRAPAALDSKAARSASERARVFFERPVKQRGQETFAFDDAVLADPGVRSALVSTCAGKCAYCETPLAEQAMLVDRFRPASGALALDGTLSPDHYWWLAYAWENLYPSCAECQSLKGARFPVRGERAVPGTTGEALRDERPLLLEPRHDDPEQHLVYAEDGSVASPTEEGRATIEILGLNRAQLLASRSDALAQVRREWEETSAQMASKAGLDPLAFDRLFDRSVPFSALRRQFLNAWAQGRRGELDQALQAAPEGPSSVAEVAGDLPVVTQAERKRVKGAFDRAQVAQDSYSLAGEANASVDYFRRTRRIERIEVRNFKVIGELDLRPPSLASSTASAPWLMLLGENGCGKSSLLQAVALTLMGANERDALGLDARTYVRNGTQSGFVRVHLAGSPEPIELRFSRRSERFVGGEDPKVILLAYGATRLLPRRGEQAPPMSSLARVRNLFDPFSPIGNSTDWLLSLDDPTFEAIARALKGLLDLESDDRLIRNRRAGRVDVEAFGLRVPLEHLSDGYQSVAALATDLMISLLQQWPTVEAAEGTVLIDELGAHLHPRWRMRIVPSLRQVFPRVQFLTSTHDPLCLRGLGDGEVVVVKRDAGGEVVAVTDLPSVAGLRVDQLLTSEHFGLNSTIDPELDALFAEYYLLKAKPHPTAADRRRLAELTTRLDGLDVLGTTRRERIVYEAADDYLAKAASLGDPGDRLELEEATKRQIREIWENAQRGKRVG
jgi:uncharacterized protein (TIGR02646 family)